MKGDKGPTGRTLSVRVVAFVGLAVVLSVVGSAAIARAGPDTVVPQASGGSQDLYFTTFSPPSVQHVIIEDRHGELDIGRPVVVARPPGADGVVFAPDGHLLVGGQNTGDVYSIDPGTDSVTPLPSGVGQSFHLSVSPDGGTVYTSGEPGQLGAVPLNPPGPGRAITLAGDDPDITGLAFGPKGQIVYTSSPASGTGNIGLLDPTTGSTHRLLGGVGAHGIVYDPFTSSYLVVGGDTVLQLPASDPGRIASELVVSGADFDQGAATGRGQLLLASTEGVLVFIDYSATKRVGDLSNLVIQRHLVAHLDDVAPLIGPGTQPVATSARLWRSAGAATVATGGVLVVGGMAFSGWRRLRRPGGRLPRWDRRRRPAQR